MQRSNNSLNKKGLDIFITCTELTFEKQLDQINTPFLGILSLLKQSNNSLHNQSMSVASIKIFLLLLGISTFFLSSAEILHCALNDEFHEGLCR